MISDKDLQEIKEMLLTDDETMLSYIEREPSCLKKLVAEVERLKDLIERYKGKVILYEQHTGILKNRLESNYQKQYQLKDEKEKLNTIIDYQQKTIDRLRGRLSPDEERIGLLENIADLAGFFIFNDSPGIDCYALLEMYLKEFREKDNKQEPAKSTTETFQLEHPEQSISDVEAKYSKPLDPEMAEVINKNFWEMYEPIDKEGEK